MRLNRDAVNMRLAAQKWTLRDLAEEMQVSPATVAGIFYRDKRGENFTPRTIGRLASALACPPEEIVLHEPAKRRAKRSAA